MKTVGKVAGIPYTLSRLRRCKNITVRVIANGEVRVSAPLGQPISTVEQVIRKNQKKLEASIAQQKEAHKLYGHSWQEGDIFLYWGKPYSLHFSQGIHDRLSIDSEKQVFGITYVGEIPNKETLSHALKEVYRDTARMRIAILVATWASTLGLVVPHFTIRDSKKRWGSCSSQGNLNFSLRSASLDDEDLSYLVLHELAHLIHFDHGPHFCALLDQHLPSWREHQQKIFSLQRRADLTL